MTDFIKKEYERTEDSVETELSGSNRDDAQEEVENEFWEDMPKQETKAEASHFLNPVLANSIERSLLKQKLKAPAQIISQESDGETPMTENQMIEN